jgi:hypothetical protein
MSIELALAICLSLALITTIVVVTYDRKSTFNKLTMLPYKLLLGYCLLSVIQFTSTYAAGEAFDLACFISINRAIMLYTALAVQNFEWFSVWVMIRFQKKLDVTNVSIEKRKFIQIETEVKKYFKLPVWGYFVLTNLRMLSGFIIVTLFKLSQNREEPNTPCLGLSPIWFIRSNINTVVCCLSIVWFVTVMAMFPRTAWKNHRAAWLEYRFRFSLQVCGTAVLLGSLMALNIMQFLVPTMKARPLMSENYLLANIVQLSACLVVAIAKQPIDLFEKFNKRPEI